MSEPEEIVYNVTVLGETVGKTSLLETSCRGKYPDSTSPTIAGTYFLKTFPGSVQSTTLKIWDTSASFAYQRSHHHYTRKSDVIILLFSWDRDDSVTRLQEEWYPLALKNTADGVTFYLVGLQYDNISTTFDHSTIDKLMQFSAENDPLGRGIKMGPNVSAKEGINVNEIFQEIVNDLAGFTTDSQKIHHQDVDFETEHKGDNNDTNHEERTWCGMM